jgi:UTP--glucose-1-phosphate uridylyltransferase
MGNLDGCGTINGGHGWRALLAQPEAHGSVCLLPSTPCDPRPWGRYDLAVRRRRVITSPNFGNSETDGRDQSSDYNPGEIMKPIRKAVFPVAGLGTRFLPATKAMPKEMLPVVDRPLIQHVVDEAREAGIEHFIFVTGRNKGVIEDHFDRQFELEHTLTERQRHEDLEALARDLPGPGTASFTRQQVPLGLGHAVWCARELVGHEPFALLLPDVLVQHNRGCLAQMIDAARGLRENANIIAVEEVPADRVHMYGVVGIGERKGRLFSLTQMVEKPAPEMAPSNLIITGRYILQPEIFEILAAEKRGTGDEIQLTDAMIELAKTQPFHGLEFEGRSFDCGSKVGFLAANVAYALERSDLAPAMRAELERLLGEGQR